MQNPTREEAVQTALQLAPASLRALAIEAGISPRLLSFIRDGERAATPRVTEKLATTLERMGAKYGAAAHAVRSALEAQAKEE
jgi:hypothetical protein